jgi:hypothetical protein
MTKRQNSENPLHIYVYKLLYLRLKIGGKIFFDFLRGQKINFFKVVKKSYLH